MRTRVLLALTWLAANLAWLHLDRLPRDGDEEGHVGAAELFAEQLRRGDLGGFLRDAWMGQLGEYPPLYAALVGGWWALTGVGDPALPWVRGINLLWPLVTATAIASIARRLGTRDRADLEATLAFSLTLLLPLPVALSRHFMPEGALVAGVATAVAVAVWAAERPSTGRALALGLALGAALLLKQTAALALVVPVLVAAWRLRARLAWTGLAAAATVGPWVARNLEDQLSYGAASIGGTGGLLAHGLYYPWALAALVLGPVVACACLLAPLRARSRAAALGAAWLVGGALLLTLIPKKYPRLAAPLAPGAALLVAAGVAGSRRPERAALAAGAGAAAWLVAASTLPLPQAEPVAGRVDERCPQVWLRAPVADDLGLAAVAAELAPLPSGPVRVVGGPEVPCAVQTTHPWAHHLAPYLRRTGEERAVLTGEDDGEAPIAELRWVGSVTAQVPVPALGGGFVLVRPTGG